VVCDGLDVDDVVAVSMFVGGCDVSVGLFLGKPSKRTRVFGVVNDPVAIAHAYLVLVVALGSVLELPCEDEVRRCRLLVIDRHLERLPRRVAQRCNDIDGWLHARLREGDGYAFGHGDMDCTTCRCGDDGARRNTDTGTGGVGCVSGQPWEGVDRAGNC
jgi:hypothetical protein